MRGADYVDYVRRFQHRAFYDMKLKHIIITDWRFEDNYAGSITYYARIYKSFPGVRALQNVSFTLKKVRSMP